MQLFKSVANVYVRMCKCDCVCLCLCLYVCLCVYLCLCVHESMSGFARLSAFVGFCTRQLNILHVLCILNREDESVRTTPVSLIYITYS